MTYELSDYVDVPARIAEFREKYPEGSLQAALPEMYRIETIRGFQADGKEVTKTFIVYAAAAYRTADDPRPGIGMAYEIFPGQTNFTRNSELQNAETSAWGRAIIAVLAADSKRGIASQEEVRNRRAEQGPAAVAESDTEWVAAFEKRIDLITTDKERAGLFGELQVKMRAKQLNPADANGLLAKLDARKKELTAA